ncbi:acyltransferase family protein [Phnomibacter sp. MR]|uniref:acyltransferase family protein n=1 Tax=Phnomibacter sp. MR TaxID=3042318 RepID=UPI003A80E440
MKTERIYQIDLIRFFAALSVLLFHYLFRGYITNDLSILRFDEIGHIFKYGYLGVDIFFIISGFVIAMSIKSESITAFIRSRITRLYPAYWFCVILTFLFIKLFGNPVFDASFFQLGVNLTMLQSFFRVDMIDGVYWSLYIELKFYMLIVLLLFLQKKFKINIDTFSYVWLVLSICYALMPASNLTTILNYLFILNWSSYFIAGMLFYNIYKLGYSTFRIIGIIVSLLLSVYFSNQRVIDATAFYKTDFSILIVAAVIICFYLIMLLISTKQLKKLNKQSFLKLGVLTYPLYLIHENIGFIIFNNIGAYINKYLLVGITTFAMLIVANLIHKKIEKPVADYIKPIVSSVLSRLKILLTTK